MRFRGSFGFRDINSNTMPFPTGIQAKPSSDTKCDAKDGSKQLRDIGLN